MTACVTFWGVRGSIPCPEPDFMEYGGHTSCVSVELGEDLLILDAGSGLQKLGRSDLVKRHKTLHLLLSHAHLDHIMGLPFFAPLYDPAYTVHFYARPATGETVDGLLKNAHAPVFPCDHRDLSRHITFSCLWRGGKCQSAQSHHRHLSPESSRGQHRLSHPHRDRVPVLYHRYRTHGGGN
jgi:phosphoribosyl 1,2-cyclic phosphodiesterase